MFVYFIINVILVQVYMNIFCNLMFLKVVLGHENLFVVKVKHVFLS